MLKTVTSYIKSIRLLPHLAVFYTSKQKEMLVYERDKWLESHRINKTGIRGLLLLLNSLPEYRTLFYFRTGAWWLDFFAHRQNNLEFYSESDRIGWGLIIWHGFSSVINAKHIGHNCQIWQNVTIGKKTETAEDDRPEIGNGVRICSGAIVVGDIKIGNNSTIGAGSVVVKNVSSDQLVVGQPSRSLNIR